MKKQIYLIILSLITFTTIYSQSESEILLDLYNYSNNLTAITSNAVSLSIDAVWLAGATTGTLTQNVNNNWTYSATPTDKLILTYSDGSSIEFKFDVITGYDEGDEDNFKNSHTMDFTTYIKDYIDLRIESTATPNSDKTYFVNKVSGTYINFGESFAVNIEHSYDTYYLVGSSISTAEFNDLVSGTVTSSSKAYQLWDKYYVSLGHNSDSGIFARDKNRWCRSAVTTANYSYAFSEMRANWYGATQFADSANAGIYNKVNESYRWSAEGNILKSDQNYGRVLFSKEVVDGTSGPYLIASLNSGKNIILSNLLNPVITSVKNENNNLPSEYSLEQNYPNPFNPSTTITFTIPNQANVKLSVYNAIGEEVAELLNDNISAGSHQVTFDASNLSSGLYFYRITAGNFVDVKKMMLVK